MQRGKDPLVAPAVVSALYSETQEAKLPSPQAQERAQEADGKVSPGPSLRHSLVMMNRTRRQHLTRIKKTKSAQ